MNDKENKPLPTSLPDLPVGSDASGGIFPKQNRWGALAFVAVVVAFFGWIAIGVNLPASRPAPEALAANLQQKLARLPKGTNVLMFLNLGAIRETDFWKSFLPDSIKSKKIVSDTSALGRFATAANITFATDVDTLVYAAINRPDTSEKILTILSGQFDTAKINAAFKSLALKSFLVNEGSAAHGIDESLWLLMLPTNELLIANDASMMQEYLSPVSSFLAEDSLMPPLINETRFKSQFWVALGSTRWAIEALRGLTASSEGVSTSGNISKVQQLTLSIDFSNGLIAESLWRYDSRTGAFFAGGILKMAVWVSEQFSQRPSAAMKKILGRVRVKQSLETLILEADISNVLLNDLRKETL